MFTRPSDYKPSPNSPHVGINLSWPESAIRSEFPNTNHDLARSTGLPKPPSYNLEWPRVTPIQVTLVTGPSEKHRIKTSIQSRVEFSSQSNSTAKTAWCITHVARQKLVPDRQAVSSRRQATSASKCLYQTTFTRRSLPYRQAPHGSSGYYHFFGSLSLEGSSRVARRHTNSAMLLVFGTLEQVLKNLKHAIHRSYYQSYLSSDNHMTESLFTHPFNIISQLISCPSSISYELLTNLFFYQMKHTTLIFNQRHMFHILTVTKTGTLSHHICRNLYFHLIPINTCKTREN